MRLQGDADNLRPSVSTTGLRLPESPAPTHTGAYGWWWGLLSLRGIPSCPSGGSRSPALHRQSRGTSMSTGPTLSVSNVLVREPLREFPVPRPAGSCLSYPRCSVISSSKVVSRTVLVNLQQPGRAGQRGTTSPRGAHQLSRAIASSSADGAAASAAAASISPGEVAASASDGCATTSFSM